MQYPSRFLRERLVDPWLWGPTARTRHNVAFAHPVNWTGGEVDDASNAHLLKIAKLGRWTQRIHGVVRFNFFNVSDCIANWMQETASFFRDSSRVESPWRCWRGPTTTCTLGLWRCASSGRIPIARNPAQFAPRQMQATLFSRINYVFKGWQIFLQKKSLSPEFLHILIPGATHCWKHSHLCSS